MVLTESKRVNINRNSSKGNQLKWFKDDLWYKADYLGYEALAEFWVSKLLRKTNVPDFVNYELLHISYDNKQYIGCKSNHFLGEDESIITLAKLFKKYKGIDVTKECAQLPEVKDRIKFVVENVIEITGLKDFGKHLTMILEIDAFFLNEDRHMNNIAIILNEKNLTFDYCPVFDNGASLFSDTSISYLLELDCEKCMGIIEAKPFSLSFDEQVDAAEELYGTQLKIWFDQKDVMQLAEQCKDFYSNEVIARVQEVIRNQLRKYEYFKSKSPLDDRLAEINKTFSRKENKERPNPEKENQKSTYSRDSLE